MQLQYHLKGATGIELQDLAFQVLGSAPTGWTGRVYFDSGLGTIRVYDGSAWVLKATDSLLLGGQNSAYHLARANHTGSQTASTISDFDTQVRTSRLDQMAAPAAAVSLNSQKITSLATPTATGDAATKGYVDTEIGNAINGVDWKASVRAATTADITLSGLQTVDGISLSAGERVLVKNQTDGTQNGIYAVASGAWSRTADADSSAEVTPGLAVFVEEGTAQGNQQWVLSTDGPITLGTTALTFTQIGATGAAPAAGNGLTLTSNTYDVVAGSTPGSGGPGGGLVANANDVVIDTGVVARRGAANLTGAGTSFTIPHGIGHADLAGVTVRNVSTGRVEYPDVVVDATNIVVTFIVAPGTNTYRVSWAG